MPRHRRLLLLPLAAIVIGLAVGLWIFWPRTAITRENAARVVPGMTLAEVEHILGGPARNEANQPCVVDVDAQPDAQVRWRRVMATGDAAPTPMQWLSNHAVIAVWLDNEGRVTSCECVYLCPEPVNLFERIRNSLGL